MLHNDTHTATQSENEKQPPSTLKGGPQYWETQSLFSCVFLSCLDTKGAEKITPKNDQCNTEHSIHTHTGDMCKKNLPNFS